MLVSATEPILRTRRSVDRDWAWLALAGATLLWPSVITLAGPVARETSPSPVAMALRVCAVFLALALWLGSARP